MEIWKTVTNYPRYKISNLGRLKSYVYKKDGKLMKPSLDGYGYLFVYLHENGKKKSRKIHQLVAQSFLGDCPVGLQINHKDGNKTNNIPNNLEYVTPKYNTNHGIYALKHYRFSQYHWKHKLTPEQVREIRHLYSTGKFTQEELAKKYNIHRGHLSKICNFKSWFH